MHTITTFNHMMNHYRNSADRFATCVRTCAMLIILFACPQVYAQVATGYTWSQAAGSYAAVGATGANALFADGWDDNQTTVTIPFSFTFDEVAYTQVTVSSNGFLVFGNTLNANNTGEAFVSSTDPSGLYLGGTGTDNGIAGFNVDMDEQSYSTVTGNRTSGSANITSVSSTTNLRVGMRLSGTGIPTNAVITNISGSTVTMSANATSGSGTSTTLTPLANVVAVTTGSSPNRVFVVQYTRVARFGYTGNDDVSFQIRLNEGGGNLANQTVQVVYGSCSTGSTVTNENPQVGIRTTTSDFNCRTTTTDWTATTAGTANTDRLRFRNTITPPSGRTYTWTPGFCSGSVTAGSISGTTPLCTGTGTTLTLSGQSSAAYGITTAWFYSTVSGGPYSTSAGSGNSIATGNLTSSRYYVATTTCSNGNTSSTTAQFAVLVNQAPTTANAGPDQTICVSSPTATMAGNTAATGTGTWTQVSGPSTATIVTPSSPTTVINALNTVGTYVFQWSIANAPCAASSDQISVIVKGIPTTANAGVDQTICATGGSATMAGNTAASGTGTWTQVSGPVTATITTPTSASTTITGMTTTGSYTFQWTIANAPCTATSDQMVVTANPAPTTANAGPDQTICVSNPSATMAGNTAAIGAGTWTQVSGPSTATIVTPSSPTTVINALNIAGTYVFQWSIANAPCTASSDQISVIVKGIPTTANAGVDQTICATGGSATMAGNTAASGAGTWTQVSGPVTATITTPTSATTTITGMTTAGSYTFQWTIANAPCTATSDQMVVTVNPAPTTANAGPDQTICVSSPSATMAGNTAAIGAGTWTQVSGPSTATIVTPSSPTTVINALNTVGTYVFQWSIANAPCAASTDQISVIVKGIPTTANAGNPQTICATSGSATMAANAAVSGAGAWTQISGPVTATITTPSSATTTITGMTTAGSYIFQWTISNAPCTASSSQVTITAAPGTTVANAGPDQTFCLSAVSTTLAANTPVNGTGAWSILAGSANTSTSQLSSTTLTTATFTPTIAGTYILRWTISNNPCSASTDDVVITVQPFAATPVIQTFNANGNFVVPAGITQITVQAWGGGGSGGGSTDAGTLLIRGGAGGGGGAYVLKTLSVTPGSTLNVVVATQVNGTSGANGVNGNPSTITGYESLVFAAGGSGGAANLSGNSPAGGAGGSLAASQGDSELAGGAGGNGATGFITGGNSGAGGAGANSGGAGGAAITTAGTTANGNNGTAPGGGGGGGHTSQNGGAKAGGAGAAGQVIISYTPVPVVSVSAATICQGSSTTLTASGGNSYLWSPGGATTSSIAVSPASSTTYSVTVTNTCPAQLTQSVTVNTKPTATATGGGTVCSTDPLPNVTFNFTGTAPYNFTYNPGAVVVTGHGSNTYAITNAAAGTYAVTALTDANCVGTSFGSSATVTVTPAVNWYADTDGDGFGSGTATQACAPPNTGDVTNNTDQCPTDPAKQLPGQCGCGVADTDSDNDGTANCNDLCPNDANKIAPGQCGCGVSDIDTDNDGTANCNDLCPNDANKIAPGQCGCGTADTDSDNDGTANCNDGCPNDANKTAPGQCGCGTADADSDSDGTANCNDGCPNDPNKIAPGQCGCGVADTDTDNDGTSNCNDLCPNDANKIAPGQCGCGVADTDSDNDGTANCNDGCPNDPNKVAPGVCGCGVTDTDSDSDGTLDCNDGCPSDPNKIAPGICGCNVADTDSDNDGTADCNDGCPNDPDKIAAGQCGCGVADTDSDTDGTADCNDGCPGDPSKIAPGICGCDTPDDDTDNDGLADCVDPCPENANNLDTDGDGTYDCVDNCPNDAGKVNPGQCGCGTADTDTDNDGAADCNDGCPNDANKIAPGTCGCGTADADNDNDGTLNCNDGCPSDPNKIAPGLCGCGVADTDSDNDGIADCNDNCPQVQGQIGSTCDDGNANTINDVLTSNCTCAGTAVANLATLELTTDNDAAATSWDIIPLAGGAAVCSGGGYGNSSTQTLNCSLPDGCYRLRVYDANLDGMCCMNGMGGYVLRTAGGQRIIDAAGAGIFSNTAEVALGFCVPIGGDKLTPSRCDRENYLPSDFIQATPNPAVQAQFNVGTQSDDGYQFWIFNPNGGYSRRVLITHATNNSQFPSGPDRCTYLRLNALTSSQIPFNMLVNVRVRSMVNGVYSEFGSACRLKIDLTNQCPTTGLLNDISNSHHSCGLVNVPLNSSRSIYATPVSGATTYQFEFSKPGYLRKITSPGSNLLMSQWATLPLQYNSTYNVRVRVSFDNGVNYCPFSTVCSLSTATTPPGNQNAIEEGPEAMVLQAWPNPNHGETLTLKLAGFGDESELEMTISVSDLFGKRIHGERLKIQGDVLNTTLDMRNCAAGVYLVTVSTVDRSWTERVIVQ